MTTNKNQFDKLKFLYTINTYTSGLPQHKASWQIYYVSIISTIIFAGFCYSIYGRSVFAGLEFGTLICDHFTNAALTICVLFNTIYLYKTGTKHAQKLLNLLNNHTSDVSKGGLLLIAIFLGLLGIIIFDVIVLCYKHPISIIQYYIFKYIKYAMMMAQILLIIFILKEISQAVVDTKKELNDSINSFMVFPVGELYESEKGMFTLTGWTKSILETKAAMSDVGKIEKCTKRYKDVYLMAHYFNSIFGWPIMFILVVVLFEIITMMDSVVSYFISEGDEKDVYFLSLKIINAFYFYICEILIVLNCDEVIEKTGTFANDTYKQILVLCESQETISEQMILRELMALWYYVINNKPKFQAGFVILRKKFIYGSFIAVSSFIAVVVEFNRFISNHNHLHKIDDEDYVNE